MTVATYINPRLVVARGDVYRDMVFTYHVPSEYERDRAYQVTLKTQTGRFISADCTCPDHQYRERNCKHIRACYARLYGKEMPDAHA